MSIDSFDDESQSVSSDSTVTAIERPLLKTSALATPMSTSRRSLSSASTAATVLQVSQWEVLIRSSILNYKNISFQVSQRTDDTPGRRHADFFRGVLSPSRSNPNLYQPMAEIAPGSGSTLSRRETTRSSSMLPPPPPYNHVDARVNTYSLIIKTNFKNLGQVWRATSA